MVTVPSGRFLITTSETLDAFAPEWPTMTSLEALGSPFSGYAFQCSDHLMVWLQTIGHALDVKPVFVKVTDQQQRTQMFLPLGITRKQGVRILGFLDGGVMDYNAPILHADAAAISAAEMAELWVDIRRAAGLFDVAVLEKISQFAGDQTNPLYSLMPDAWPVSGHTVSVPKDRATVSPHAADSRRQRKRLAEQGELTFRIARDSEEIERVFDAFIRQKSRRYEETGVPNGLNLPDNRAYYRNLADHPPEEGVHLSSLSVGDEIIATHWGLVTARRFYFMMPTYEAGPWRKFSAGRLLMEELIAWSHAQGIECFDLGIGDEAYKEKWKDGVVNLAGGRFPQTAVGHAYCAALRSRKAIMRSLPPKVLQTLKDMRAYMRN
jgi:CelD/BcsL family acetyltransferase involved in cellulose biosynthesis